MSGRVGLMVVGLGLLATGCPNPNLYGTPRTTPAGKGAGFVALEGFGWSVKTKKIVPQNDTWNPDQTYTGKLPMAPSFGGRFGIAERFDMGLRLSGFTTPGADVKWNFLRTDVLDLAVDAGAEYALFSAFRVHLPLLVGLNFSEKVSLVLLPGVMYGMSTLDDRISEDSTFRTVTSTGGWYGRAGVGLNIRFNRKVAIQPEITFVKAFKQEQDEIFDDVLVYNFGLGLSFGNLPEYGPPEPTAPPPTLPPAPTPTPAAPSAAPAAPEPALPPPPPPPSPLPPPSGPETSPAPAPAGQ
jgi:hypothetical protein